LRGDPLLCGRTRHRRCEQDRRDQKGAWLHTLVCLGAHAQVRVEGREPTLFLDGVSTPVQCRTGAHSSDAVRARLGSRLPIESKGRSLDFGARCCTAATIGALRRRYGVAHFNYLIRSRLFTLQCNNFSCHVAATLLPSAHHEWPSANLDGHAQGLGYPVHPIPCPLDWQSNPLRSVQ
jgi:hypothetical protein